MKGQDEPGKTARMLGVVYMPLLIFDLYLIIFWTIWVFISELVVNPLYGNRFAAGLILLILGFGMVFRVIYRRRIIRQSKSQASEITSSNP
ncbi:MAG: hypothetical protein ISN29_09040 [Gammaproteobacteria bacterium AqS3]|nr:hypothetical protein [Gammaproteobacteria bacterium AqS3]